MTDANLTEIVCVLDRSGSMYSILDDAVGGINSFISEQRGLPGEAHVTITLFNTWYEIVHEATPVSEVPEFTRETYRCGGATALYDAVGGTIDQVGRRLAATPEEKRPGKVLFVILTDGHENSSRKYTFEQVRDMIDRQQNEWNWQFIYLSADVRAFEHAASFGIGTQVAYQGTGQSISSSLSVASSAAKQYRHSGAGGMSILDSCVSIGSTGDVKIEGEDSET